MGRFKAEPVILVVVVLFLTVCLIGYIKFGMK